MRELEEQQARRDLRRAKDLAATNNQDISGESHQDIALAEGEAASGASAEAQLRILESRPPALDLSEPPIGILESRPPALDLLERRPPSLSEAETTSVFRRIEHPSGLPPKTTPILKRTEPPLSDTPLPPQDRKETAEEERQARFAEDIEIEDLKTRVDRLCQQYRIFVYDDIVSAEDLRQSLIKRVIKFRQSDDYIDRTLGAEYTRAQKLAYEHKATVQRRAEEEFRRLEAQEQARREFELEKLRLQVQISQGPLRKISRKSYLQRQPRGSTTSPTSTGTEEIPLHLRKSAGATSSSTSNPRQADIVVADTGSKPSVPEAGQPVTTATNSGTALDLSSEPADIAPATTESKPSQAGQSVTTACKTSAGISEKSPHSKNRKSSRRPVQQDIEHRDEWPYRIEERVNYSHLRIPQDSTILRQHFVLIYNLLGIFQAQTAIVQAYLAFYTPEILLERLRLEEIAEIRAVRQLDSKADSKAKETFEKVAYLPDTVLEHVPRNHPDKVTYKDHRLQQVERELNRARGQGILSYSLNRKTSISIQDIGSPGRLYSLLDLSPEQLISFRSGLIERLQLYFSAFSFIPSRSSVVRSHSSPSLAPLTVIDVSKTIGAIVKTFDEQLRANNLPFLASAYRLLASDLSIDERFLIFTDFIGRIELVDIAWDLASGKFRHQLFFPTHECNYRLHLTDEGLRVCFEVRTRPPSRISKFRIFERNQELFRDSARAVVITTEEEAQRHASEISQAPRDRISSSRGRRSRSPRSPRKRRTRDLPAAKDKSTRRVLGPSPDRNQQPSLPRSQRTQGSATTSGIIAIGSEQFILLPVGSPNAGQYFCLNTQQIVRELPLLPTKAPQIQTWSDRADVLVSPPRYSSRSPPPSSPSPSQSASIANKGYTGEHSPGNPLNVDFEPSDPEEEQFELPSPTASQLNLSTSSRSSGFENSDDSSSRS